MRVLPCSVLLLLLLLALSVLTQAKHQSEQGRPDKPRQPPPSPQPKRARHRSVSGSGELSTKEGHRCTWQTAAGGGLVNLLVNCSTETLGEQQRYWCRYAGKPDLCQAYGLKSSQYWKQLVGKLKKRQNACEGEKVLKAKTCKKAPAEAHMKLAQRGGEEEEEKKGGRDGGKKRVPPANRSSEGGKAEKKKKEEEEEKERTGVDEEERMLNDMEPVQNYCSEGWHSVCSFFVRFFEG